jgi:hypothetical protein
MSFDNPTSLRVGMSGTLLGKAYRVAGRVVMGMEDAGETYYWNEFNLVSSGGDSTTLVFEETERGGEWRLFTMFEPDCPIPAEDAATKAVGDPLNLDGTDVQVTLVDESRVYYIEGQAPAGVEVGDVARYFNAEAGDTMIVVSWTGSEVECFHGENLSAQTVASAFGVSVPAAGVGAGFANVWSKLPAEGKRWSWVVPLFLVGGIAVASYAACFSKPSRGGPRKTGAPATSVAVGNRGLLGGHGFRVESQTLLEMARVRSLAEQREFELVDESSGQRLILVAGLLPETKKWFLFRPMTLGEDLPPTQAAAVQPGQVVRLDGLSVVVSQLFQVTVRQVENAAMPVGKTWYGFLAESGASQVLVRWDDERIQAYRGTSYSPAEIKAAFTAKP